MKALILAGGFGTRLKPYVQDFPKALLEVAGKPILSHLIQKLGRIREVDRILISTNTRFKKHFEQFLDTAVSEKPLMLVVEKASSENEKLGSIGGLHFVIDTLKIDDDLLILGGDNMFDLDLKSFVRKATVPMIGVCDVKDVQIARRYGIVETDSDGFIIGFEEKPEHPKSTLASTFVYFFPKRILCLLEEYIKEGGPRDRMGDFISYLHQRERVYAFRFDSAWYDIGCIDSLEAARKHYALSRKSSIASPKL